MAHHSSHPESPIREEIKKMYDRARQLTADDLHRKLGATGQFPRGKIAEDDEGEIRIAIGQKDGTIVIDFGKPTAWIGFTPDQADSIAQLLIKHANAIRSNV